MSDTERSIRDAVDKLINDYIFEKVPQIMKSDSLEDSKSIKELVENIIITMRFFSYNNINTIMEKMAETSKTTTKDLSTKMLKHIIKHKKAKKLDEDDLALLGVLCYHRLLAYVACELSKIRSTLYDFYRGKHVKKRRATIETFIAQIPRKALKELVRNRDEITLTNAKKYKKSKEAISSESESSESEPSKSKKSKKSKSKKSKTKSKSETESSETESSETESSESSGSSETESSESSESESGSSETESSGSSESESESSEPEKKRHKKRKEKSSKSSESSSSEEETKHSKKHRETSSSSEDQSSSSESEHKKKKEIHRGK
jgi:hypothetical protein